MSKVCCDLCGSEMEMEMFKGTMPGAGGDATYPKLDVAIFRCRNHPPCSQVWTVDREGGTTCKTKKNIWPSDMEESSEMYRKGYLPSWLEGKKHFASMMLAAGFWTQEENDKFLKDCQESYDAWFKENPEPQTIIKIVP